MHSVILLLLVCIHKVINYCTVCILRERFESNTCFKMISLSLIFFLSSCKDTVPEKEKNSISPLELLVKHG